MGPPSKFAFRAGLIYTLAATAVLATEGRPKSITLATIPESIPAVKADGAITTPERPGFRVIVLVSAGKQCGVAVNFAPVPWSRALEMVKNGGADGAFSSSYTEERAVYGAYPLKNGVPDPQKAMKGYTYSLYIHADSKLTWDGKHANGADKKVIVERGSVGTDVAIKAGLEPLEVASYTKMVRMLAEKRAAGMVGIDTQVDKRLIEEPELAKHIKRVDPPLEAKHGYVMFAKPFYAANSELVECFWKALGEIRARPAYNKLVRSYNNGNFAE